MALDYGLKGSIDIADSRTRALTLRADGEPVFNPAANRWADELKASDGARRFLRGGQAAGRGVGNSFDAALADNFTVLCLVRAKKPNWGAVLRKMSDGATVGWAAQQAPQRSSGLYVRVDPTVNANLARCEYTKPKDLDWHWYSFSFSGLNIYSWLDAGARKSETRPTGDLTNTQNFVAGTGSSTSHIAATLIYSRVLTDAEVQSLMSGRTMPREVSGLIGYYKFNEGSGVQCTDHSGQGNHLTYTSPVWETFDPASTAKTNFASGQPYTPAVLKSSNWWDRMPPAIADPEMMGCSWGAIGSIAYQPVMNITGDLTAAVWHKPLKVRSNGELISIACSYVSANGPISIQFRGLTVSVNVGNTATQTSSTFVLSKPVPLGKWTHWCVTLSGTTLSLYINGILIGTATNAAAHGTTSAFVSLIDFSSGTRNAARSIRLFSRALSASEVNELFLTDRIGNRTKAELTYGPELVTNGDFSNGTAGWSALPTSALVGGASISVASGVLRVTNNATNTDYGICSQSFQTVAGKQYVVTLTRVAASSGTVHWHVGTAGNGNNVTSILANQTGSSALFTATGATTFINLGAQHAVANAWAEWDNISVREITGVTPGLVGEWLCNTTHSTTISDTSGNGLHATTSNPRLLDSPYQVARRKRFGKQLRGGSALSVLPLPASLQVVFDTSSKISIAFWAKGNVRNYGDLLKLRNSASQALLAIAPANSVSTLFIGIRSAGSDTETSFTALVVDFMQYNFYSMSVDFSAKSVSIYVNGVCVGVKSNVTQLTQGTLVDADSFSFGPRGVIDSVRIYNRSLSAAEHYQLYLDQAPRNGLVAEYLFENDVSNCQDTSGNGFHATWSGISAANYVSEL
jgi:hypothetical protein